MSNSNLVKYIHLVDNYNDRAGNKISRIIIHHMAGNLDLVTLGRVFESREGSATYGIDVDGGIGRYLDESVRPWTSSSWEADKCAVTIEVANDGGAPDWHVSDKSIEALINLCVDICKRNGIASLNYTGDKTGNLHMHKWYAATACPGPYLASKFPYIAEQVNKKLGSNSSATKTEPASTEEVIDQILHVGSYVTSVPMKLEVSGGVAIKNIDGDECCYLPRLGGWFPTRFVSEYDASDGAKDNYLANTNARVYVDRCRVEKVDVANNLVMIHGIWVRPEPLTEIR